MATDTEATDAILLSYKVCNVLEYKILKNVSWSLFNNHKFTTYLRSLKVAGIIKTNKSCQLNRMSLSASSISKCRCQKLKLFEQNRFNIKICMKEKQLKAKSLKREWKTTKLHTYFMLSITDRHGPVKIFSDVMIGIDEIQISISQNHKPE